MSCYLIDYNNWFEWKNVWKYWKYIKLGSIASNLNSQYNNVYNFVDENWELLLKKWWYILKIKEISKWIYYVEYEENKSGFVEKWWIFDINKWIIFSINNKNIDKIILWKYLLINNSK